MSADDQMARDHGRDMRTNRVLRELEDAIAVALPCFRVKGTKLGEDLYEIRVKVREYRAQIVRAWN